jgi:hypothetical protein
LADEAAGVWKADERKGDNAAVCDCFFNNYPCKLRKPTELNCYFGCRDLYTDCW